MRRNLLASSVVMMVAALAQSACGAKSSDAGATAGGGGDAGVDSASGLPTVGAASIGPIDVAAGGEETVCIFKRLDNTEDIMATDFVADLAPGSHHLIVYKSTYTDEDLTPTACTPFLGLLDKTAIPILLVGAPHLAYSFPTNVGLAIPAHQMVKIEAHYINATAAQIEGTGSFSLHGIPLAQATGYQLLDFGFWGTKNIDIKPASTYSTGVLYQTGIAGSTVFAVGAHQHELGTRAQIWSAAGPEVTPGDGGRPSAPPAGAQLLDQHDWANQQLTTLDPPVVFDGTNGLDFQCDWNNPTSQEIQFGESALNEMCFAAFYYYPSHGFDLCIDGRCVDR